LKALPESQKMIWKKYKKHHCPSKTNW